MTERADSMWQRAGRFKLRTGLFLLIAANAAVFVLFIVMAYLHGSGIIDHEPVLGILLVLAAVGSYVSYRILRNHENLLFISDSAEADTLQANARLDAFFGGAPAGMAILDRELNCTKWNATLAAMGGRSPFDFEKGCRIVDALPEEDAEALAAAFRQSFETGESVAGMEILGPRDPETGLHRVWTSAHFPIWGEDGKVEALGLVVTDVTDQRKTRSRIENTARELAMAQQIAGIGSWRWKVATNEESWSDQIYRNLGLEPGCCDASADRLFESVHPDDRDGVRRAIEEAVKTGSHYSSDFRIVRPDGTIHIVHEEAAPLIGEDGQVVELFGTMQDVTEQRSTENHLARLSESFANAQRIAGVGNWDWDAATKNEWWSDEVYRILGLAPQSAEASFEVFLKLTHPDDREKITAKIKHAQEHAGAYDTVFRVIRPDGAERVVRETGEAILDDKGNLTGLSGTIQDITEQHRAEQERAATAQRLEMAMRLARLGSWEWDPESNLITTSDETRRAYGLDPEQAEIDNDIIAAMLPQEDHARIARLMERAITVGEPYAHEYLIRWPNGEVRRLLEHAAPLEDAASGKVSLIGAVRDVTEQRQAEEALRQSEQRFQLAFQLSPGMTAISEIETGRHIDVNDKWVEVLGHTREEAIGRTAAELGVWHDPEDRTRAIAMLTETGELRDFEACFRTKTGEVRDIVVSAEQIPINGKAHMLIVGHDVTERKRIENALKESEELFRSVFDQAAIGIAQVTPAGSFVKANPELIEFLGYATDELQALSFHDVTHPDDLHEEISNDKRLLAGEISSYTMEKRYVRADASIAWGSLTTSVVRNEDGSPKYLIGIIKDIDDRKKAEQALSETLHSLAEAQRIGQLGSWELNPASGELTWSAENYRLLGVSPETFTPNYDDLMELVHPDDREAMTARNERLLAGEVVADMEYRAIRPDGELRSFLSRGEAIRNDDGKIVRLRGTVQDITERKAAETEIRRTARRLEEAQRLAHVGHWERRLADTEVSFWSDEMMRILGLAPGTPLPTHADFFQMVHVEDRDRLHEAMDETLRTGEPYEMEFRVRRADGEYRHIFERAERYFDASSGQPSLRGIVQDITERKRVEGKLRETLRNLEEAQRVARLGSWNWEIEEDKEWWSDETYRIFGLEIGSVVFDAYGYLEYVHPDDRERAREAFDRARREEMPYDVEYRLINARGEEVFVSEYGEMEYGADGKPVRMRGTLQDITERKRVEEKLRETLENLEKSQRIAGLGSWVWDAEKNEEWWSDQLYRIFAMEVGSEVRGGYDFLDYVHADDRDHAHAAYDKAVSEGAPYTVEYRAWRADDREIVISEFGEWEFNENGKPVRMRGTTQDITERKAAEEKLREITRNLEETQRIAKLGSWVWDIETDDEWWSDEIYRMLGMTRGEPTLGGYDFLDHVHPDDQERVRTTLQEAISEGEPYAAEFRVRHADGHEMFFSEIGETEYDETGKAVRMRGSTQDVTERKLAEQALQESEARLDAFFSKAPVAMGIVDSECRYVQVNDTLARMNDLPVVDHIGKRPSDILYPEKAKHIETLMRRTLANGESLDRIESVIPNPDGSIQHRVYSQFPLAGDPRKPDSIAFVVIDVTDLKKAELKLAKLARNLEEAQRIAHLGSWEWSPDDVDIEWWSDETYRIFGLEPGSITLDGFGFLRYVHPDDRGRVERVQRRAAKTGEPFACEYRIVRPDGTIRTVSEQGEMERGEDGKAHWWGVMLDITEFKRIQEELAALNADLEQRVEERTAELRSAQAELIKSERLATLGQLTATVSHELRNPLGAMRTSMYVIEKKTEALDERLDKAIERVNRNIMRCDRIIDELLDYTRIRDLEIINLRIDSWLGAVLDEQPRVEGVVVRRKFGTGDTRAPADSDRLRRAVINLYDNACQALLGQQDSGDTRKRKELTVETRVRADRVEIRFADNGCGVPDDLKEKIFEPLFSTKNFGVGLGLPTVKQIMTQHGGGIDIRDRRGGGAIFALWLPLSTELESTDA